MAVDDPKRTVANHSDYPIAKKEYMDWLGRLFDWIANHEAVLSGIAATIAIVAVVFALSSRTLGLFRSRAEKVGNYASRKPSLLRGLCPLLMKADIGR